MTEPDPQFDAADRDTLDRILRWRRDMRHFRTDPVPEALLDELRAAMELAPSVGNSRPWRVVRVESPALRAEIRADFLRCNAKAAAGYQGEASIDPNLPPAMKAKVTATGLDKIQAALQAAPPEQAQQPLMMLQMAQMMGKPGANGELVWDIDATDPSGAVSVNGTVMGGAPAPQQ